MRSPEKFSAGGGRVPRGSGFVGRENLRAGAGALPKFLDFSHTLKF